MIAVKVSFALHRAVILARRFVQFDANPVSRGELGSSHEADNGLPPIRKADELARSKTTHCD